MIIMSFGAGTNSTAMLQGLLEHGEHPDAILFSDTGGERPETYLHMRVANDWCKRNGFPEITIVKKGGIQETLEQNCLRMHALPSLAYGFKTCSHKFKIEPQNRWMNNNIECKSSWENGDKVTKLIGIDADEHHRAKFHEDDKYVYRYPLIEWDWGRGECIAAIKRMGICQPGKSSCFFCPAMKKHEIREMAVIHPDLIERALELERNAETTSVKGLGRSFSWSDLLAQQDMFEENFISVQEACDCYDG